MKKSLDLFNILLPSKNWRRASLPPAMLGLLEIILVGVTIKIKVLLISIYIHMFKIGQQISDFQFEVFHQEKIKKISFGDYRGKWLVLLFYPADFTFVCPTELEDAAEKYADFQKMKAEVISISTDTAYVHKAWHDHSAAIKKVNYPMAADPTGRICRAFGTYIEDEGVSVRATYIIDPDQKVVAIDMHDNSIGRNIDEIYRKLQAADFVRQNGGAIVCPAKWKPGDKVLKPGVDLVGKI